MRDTIITRLSEIQAEENIQILYACESGSRAWGFPSADSDYDVRFIYIHPVEWYLSIEEKRDVIERPLENGLDANGWDLRKALKLFRKSNPPLMEWLGSPIIYIERSSVAAQMRQLAPVYYSPKACLYHYLHMAQGNFREYLMGDVVWLKKYFYVLRPLLAMNWIERNLGVVPTDFNILVAKLISEQALKRDIDQLIKEKCSGAELDRGPRIETISNFIETELARWEYPVANYQISLPAPETLDKLFRDNLWEVWQVP